ncbi:protein SUPPRESSOR OF npr1-1, CONSTITUTIVE 1-like isoform X2 [Vigna radiata var. radiata]|uniref:Protein SUPPRESSOR OF npr1-1, CONSTITUTIVE 1-like isoform X2 n=1 Tax=Vigna radiata var. radiata TaxID=3916 RepID=A0A1S3VE92_VIGRR|nr:protein SUPPRESSOR OF npr1-1, CONSTITUTIVE 1-like isoform X2 [Vigna radiata var. radiata]
MEFASSSSLSSSSSSFLTSEPHFIHDVFINFGGEDIGRRFVSHLHSVLLQSQVKTFISQENLHDEGMKLEEHMRAIGHTKITIIVFSKSYTESACSLLELEKIIECHETFGQIVLPVFHEIDPLDVRHQKDDFGKALEDTAHRSYSGEQLQHARSRWSSALNRVAGMTGWDVRHFGHDAALVDVIVNRVKTLLDYRDLFITSYPVGLESRVEDVIKCIENQSTKVCMIGIWGMGGSEYLLSDVLESKLKVKSVGMGRTMIQNEFSRKKLLIVLDDVNEFGQLENLCGRREWFGQGTVIIITTRDFHLLNQLKVNYVYEMDLLNENESLELFSSLAFGDAKAKEDFSELSRNVVAYCGGLPLALEVLGAYLFDQTSKRVWEGVLSILEKIPNKEVQRKLRISFDSLSNDMEKDILLDVCCFFIGKDRGYVTEILNGCELCADVGIPVLIERSLIKVEKNNKLGMHPLLQEMGREIIRENSRKDPGKHSRLWSQKEVVEVLTKNTGTEAIEGLVLKMDLTSRDCFKTDSFKKMERLRLLQLHHVQLDGNYAYLSKQLKWISWHGFPSNSLPNSFCMNDVIAIDLKYSHLRFVWKQSQDLKWLKFLNLSHSMYLRETPDFSRLPSLEQLILKDCPSLLGIHKSIGDLCNILLINLKDCTSLSNLPKEIYKLKSVKTFILSGCSKIDKLEEDIAQMESLTTLIADNTAVKQVPVSIVTSKSIGYISLCGFEGLARNVFPSIILSWMSPTMNPLLFMRPFSGTSCSLVSMNTQDNTLSELAPMLRSLPNLRSVLLRYETESQLSKDVETFLVERAVNVAELGISRHHLRSSLIGVGSYKAFFEILNDRISKGLVTNEASEVSLPIDNKPYWLAHIGEGQSVFFTVPEDCGMKGMTLCIVYLSNPEIKPTECLTSVLIANYTKRSLQIHRQETVISFNDEDWQEIISHLAGGDKVEIFVTFGHDLVVKKTAVYLMYGESKDIEIELTNCESNGVEIEPPHCESIVSKMRQYVYQMILKVC